MNKKLKLFIWQAIFFFSIPFFWMQKINLVHEQNIFIIRYLGAVSIQCCILILFCILMIVFHISKDYLNKSEII